MAHLVRILTDAKIKRGLVLTGANLDAIDQNTFVGINGDAGGTWSPSTPITIAGGNIPNGGPCVVVAGPWTMSGAGVTVTTATGKYITFGKGDANDYFGYAPGHPGASPSVFTDFVTADSATGFQALYSADTGIQTRANGARFFASLDVYSGAPMIAAVVVDFQVNDAHGGNPGVVPQVLPKMRVIAVAADGTVTPLRAKDATTDADGFQFIATPASGFAWFNANLFQSWTYTCNVALPVDSSLYLYFVEIVDESGTGAWVSLGNKFRDATVVYSNITVFDGRN